MLFSLLSLALAAPVEGRVTVRGASAPDARIEVIDSEGLRTATVAYTDRKGRFSLDAQPGTTLRVSRVVRTEDGHRRTLLALAVPLDEAQRIELDHIDIGAGATRLTRPRALDARDALRSVSKSYRQLHQTCDAILGAEERSVARDVATEQAADLAIGFGTGFEGCALRRFGETSSAEVAERATHNLDAAAGPGGQPLWAGLASAAFAEWSLDHNDPTRARRAAGAAVTRLGGLTSSRAGTQVGEAARPLLARAYEVEAEAAMIEQDPGGAVAKFYQALRVYKQTGDVGGMGRSELGIARAELARGRREQAQEHLIEAQSLPLSGQHTTLFSQVQAALATAPGPVEPAVDEEDEAATPAE